MKVLLFVLLLLFVSPSCNDGFSHDFNMDKPDVEVFVRLIKKGTYECSEVSETGELLWLKMPGFTRNDIPGLLNLASDLTQIKSFPDNPISSIRLDYMRLGECLLWVVEGIRIGRPYGSLTPSLSTAGEIIAGSSTVRRLTDEEVLEVRQLYLDWWKKVQADNFLMERINPLKDTRFSW